MDDIKSRLSYFLKERNISKSEFGRTIGVSSAYITSIRKSIQPEKIDKIAECYPELNIAWLLTGEGEMLKQNNPVQHVIGEKNMAVQGNGNNVNATEILEKILESLRDQQKIMQEQVSKSQEQVSKAQEQLSKAQEQMDRLITLLEKK